MTVVRFEIERDIDGGFSSVEGSLLFQPTRRREEGDSVVLPPGFSTPISSGEFKVGLNPTGPGWCWKIVEMSPGGTTRYVKVPLSLEELAYTDLEDVDPDTLDPATPPTAEWWAAVDQLEAETILLREQSEQFATEAGESSVSSASSASTALAARNEAVGARDVAVGASGTASTARDQANTARDLAVTARGGSETARDQSVAAKAAAEAARDIAMAQTFAGSPLGTAHLDTITVDGVYRQDTLANATVARGYVRDNIIASMVVASVNAGNKTQVMTIVGGAGATFPTVVSRRMAGGTWAAWRTSPTHSVDYTAGLKIRTWDDVLARDQLVYGDTGWRNISATVTWDDTRTDAAKTRTAYIRRQGYFVSIIATFSLPTGFPNTYGPIFTAGSALQAFRPQFTTPVREFHTTGNRPTAGVTAIEVSANLSAAYITGWTTGGSYTMSSEYMTTEAWGTALPGSLWTTPPSA